jgi:DNA-directed RNA polymerase subunit beta
LKHLKVTNGVVDLESTPIYLSAEEEEGMLISQANIQMDNSGKITAENVIARQEGDFPVIDPVKVDYADVAPNQIASISLLYSFLGT